MKHGPDPAQLLLPVCRVLEVDQIQDRQAFPSGASSNAEVVPPGLTAS